MPFLLGEKISASYPGPPPLLQSQPGPAPTWRAWPHWGAWQCWRLEASASPGAWDPAELEQVGPIGQDLETRRGAAPGTQEHRGPAQPARPVLLPTVIVGWGLPLQHPGGVGGGRWG